MILVTFTYRKNICTVFGRESKNCLELFKTNTIAASAEKLTLGSDKNSVKSIKLLAWQNLLGILYKVNIT